MPDDLCSEYERKTRRDVVARKVRAAAVIRSQKKRLKTLQQFRNLVGGPEDLRVETSTKKASGFMFDSGSIPDSKYQRRLIRKYNIKGEIVPEKRSYKAPSQMLSLLSEEDEVLFARTRNVSNSAEEIGFEFLKKKLGELKLRFQEARGSLQVKKMNSKKTKNTSFASKKIQGDSGTSKVGSKRSKKVVGFNFNEIDFESEDEEVATDSRFDKKQPFHKKYFWNSLPSRRALKQKIKKMDSLFSGRKVKLDFKHVNTPVLQPIETDPILDQKIHKMEKLGVKTEKFRVLQIPSIKKEVASQHMEDGKGKPGGIFSSFSKAPVPTVESQKSRAPQIPKEEAGGKSRLDLKKIEEMPVKTRSLFPSRNKAFESKGKPSNVSFGALNNTGDFSKKTETSSKMNFKTLFPGDVKGGSLLKSKEKTDLFPKTLSQNRGPEKKILNSLGSTKGKIEPKPLFESKVKETKKVGGDIFGKKGITLGTLEKGVPKKPVLKDSLFTKPKTEVKSAIPEKKTTSEKPSNTFFPKPKEKLELQKTEIENKNVPITTKENKFDFFKTTNKEGAKESNPIGSIIKKPESKEPVNKSAFGFKQSNPSRPPANPTTIQTEVPESEGLPGPTRAPPPLMNKGPGFPKLQTETTPTQPIQMNLQSQFPANPGVSFPNSQFGQSSFGTTNFGTMGQPRPGKGQPLQSAVSTQSSIYQAKEAFGSGFTGSNNMFNFGQSMQNKKDFFQRAGQGQPPQGSGFGTLQINSSQFNPTQFSYGGNSGSRFAGGRH